MHRNENQPLRTPIVLTLQPPRLRMWAKITLAYSRNQPPPTVGLATLICMQHYDVHFEKMAVYSFIILYTFINLSYTLVLHLYTYIYTRAYYTYNFALLTREYYFSVDAVWWGNPRVGIYSKTVTVSLFSRIDLSYEIHIKMAAQVLRSYVCSSFSTYAWCR